MTKTKVWNTNIDEVEETKPTKLSTKDAETDKDCPNNGSGDEDDEKVVIRRMIRLDDFNTVLALSDIESVEKISRFIEKPTPRYQFGIGINSGIEKCPRFPKVDIEAWYEKMELRDKRFEELMKKLEEYGYKILN